jgi:membrane-associated phospholipid phosphatase
MCKLLVAGSIVSLALVAACATRSPVAVVPSAALADTSAGGWRTWVLSSGQEMRLPPPPDAAATAIELQEVRALVSQRDAAAQERIRYAPRAARAYALVHVAHYEGWIASQDAKFHYWTARPGHFDSTVTTVIPTPPFPTYPSNAAALAAAPAAVLTHLFPRERARYEEWTREFGESRLWAGIHFRSDITSGWDLGRQVGAAVVARAKGDGA